MRPRSFSDEDLLETAKRMFLESGPGLSTTRIADALGVSQAALFKRFSTKKQLMVRALLPSTMPKWIERIGEGPDDRPVPEQLLEIVHEIDEFFSRMMPALSIIRAAGITPDALLKNFPGGPPPVRANNALTEFFETLHQQGRAKIPHPRVAATAFLGSIHCRHNLCHMLGDQAPDFGENYPDHMVELFWAGMKPD
jgi:AcrR family transcriptional regulator